MIRNVIAVLALFAYLSIADGADLVKETDYQILYATQGEFEEVKQNLELAITDQGLVVNNVADIGSMLDKTGVDLGEGEQLYLNGQVLEFCSAVLSREKMKADPANIVFCPFTMHIYELPTEPGVIYAGYRRPTIVGNEASQAALQKIDVLLREILTEAMSW